ncbi:exodeoxyribonuclease III [Borrelia miyamotoi]|uniref:Exodeoxyribonuclease III n=1 Tax=Borrelia miyamotoi TaxID=47466 RepID=A0AAX3JM19_9SPIR|nr:exodeoxyribonuclease III [Borrelia miyamotoi]QFP41820.1 exodeoxyribonuclease III [Borrelia miyamotoi]QFP47940.1 exodeoxyribonuclease III [Borrelia miyamotoi]QGT55699.1 exodeoxyribonuclease III [Borrelia miyamotoi]QGT56481.1 exodeoxyribonuclease III [Borrelia miyamotoi]WAZ71729.1 exodeoxyribonuclease III [Borrelia miyamotoi]
MNLISWNVNGIRSIFGKGFLEFIEKYSPDILCLQETKACKEQLPKELINVKGYYSYFAKSIIKGYSGVGIYSRIEPIKLESMNIEKFDREGRCLIVHYPDFILINAYFPNSQSLRKRLNYKLEFLTNLESIASSFVNSGKDLIICGDFNIAHTEIDLSAPKTSRESAGFYIEETTWMDNFLHEGYVDTFRIFNKESGNYTWWDYRTKARTRNIGWRIDYFVVNGTFKSKVRNALILSEVMGSDHCPVFLDLN